MHQEGRKINAIDTASTSIFSYLEDSLFVVEAAFAATLTSSKPRFGAKPSSAKDR
jgi:hypothetical protein